MDSLVKKMDRFLETQKITWIDKRVYDSAKTIYRPAVDKDFLDQSFQKVLLRNAKGKIFNKFLVATEELFLVFDEQLRKLEKNISAEWIKYQTKFAENQEDDMEEPNKEGKKKFSKYIDEDKYNC